MSDPGRDGADDVPGDETPGDETPAGPAGEPADEHRADEHRADGLDLARSVARRYRAVGPERSGRSATPRAPGTTGGAAPGRWSRRRRRTDEPTLSGPSPDDRDPQTLDSTLGRLVDEHGWETEVAVHGLFGRWPQIVGAEVSAHCRPVRYSDGELWVQADSTAWATQLRLIAPTVVAKLNERLGNGTVTRINVRGPQAPSWSKGGRSVRGRGPRDTYG